MAKEKKEIWEKKSDWLSRLAPLDSLHAKERATAAKRIKKEIELKDPEIAADRDIQAILTDLCETHQISSTARQNKLERNKDVKPRRDYNDAGFISSYQPSKEEEKKLRGELSNILHSNVSETFFDAFKEIITKYRVRAKQEKGKQTYAEIKEELKALKNKAIPLLEILGTESHESGEYECRISAAARAMIDEYLEPNAAILSKFLQDPNKHVNIEEYLDNEIPILDKLTEHLFQTVNALEKVIQELKDNPHDGKREKELSRRELAYELAAAYWDEFNKSPSKTRNGPFEQCLKVAIRESGETPPENIFPLVKEIVDSVRHKHFSQFTDPFV